MGVQGAVTRGQVTIDDPSAGHPLFAEPLFEGHVRKACLHVNPGKYRAVMWLPDGTWRPGWVVVTAASSYFLPQRRPQESEGRKGASKAPAKSRRAL